MKLLFKDVVYTEKITFKNGVTLFCPYFITEYGDKVWIPNKTGDVKIKGYEDEITALQEGIKYLRRFERKGYLEESEEEWKIIKKAWLQKSHAYIHNKWVLESKCC